MSGDGRAWAGEMPSDLPADTRFLLVYPGEEDNELILRAITGRDVDEMLRRAGRGKHYL